MAKDTKKFKVGTKVFYPAHGAGKIVGIKDIDFAGEVKSYYEFEFINTPLTISTPVDNIDRLGVRHVNSPEAIKKTIGVLKKKPKAKPPTENYNELMNIIKNNDLSGEIKAFIEIIQFCNHVKKTREEDGRLLPSSIVKHTRNAISYLVGELSLAKNITYEKGAEEFTKITGLPVD